MTIIFFQGEHISSLNNIICSKSYVSKIEIKIIEPTEEEKVNF